MLTESERSHYLLWHGIYGEPELLPVWNYYGSNNYEFIKWTAKFPNGAIFQVQLRMNRGKLMPSVPIARIWTPEEETMWMIENRVDEVYDGIRVHYEDIGHP